MRNVFRILKRDILRLLKVPSAIVVVLALLVLPSVYTWYNVIGFWDPYNNTGNLRVQVVNQDEGASSDLTGRINVGDKIVDALKENSQLDWEFTDFDTGMQRLESGQAYAMFVIPEDFSSDLLTITTGTFKQPDVTYYVNEKLGPVAPKITDTGATTLDETINSTFVSTVSEAAVDAIDSSISKTKADGEKSQSEASERISEAISGIDDTVAAIDEMAAKASGITEKVQSIRTTLDSVKSSIGDAAQTLEDMAASALALQTTLDDIAQTAQPAVNQAVSTISQTASKTAETVNSLADAASNAQADIKRAIDDAQNIVDANDAVIASLDQTVQSIPDGTVGKAQLQLAVTNLRNANERMKDNLRTLESANDKAGQINASAKTDIEAINGTIQQAASDASSYSNTLFGSVVPSLKSSLASLAGVASSAAQAVSGQIGLIDSAYALTDDMDAVVKQAVDALGQTSDMLLALKSDLETVRTDVVALGQSDAIASLVGEDVADGLDPQKIADFMGSPTNLVTEQLYTLNSYGAAMAPLFMNLTFWIGAFMLMVIMRQEVDGKGIRNLTLTQRYLGRFSLFAIMVVLQASICCAGLPVIGVEIQSLPALFFAAIVAALSYLSIIYALSVSLQHIGKGICIILVFAQIPGATGLYPIEMTAPFFQAIYPALPFTYGISAMRESICGFYGFQYMLDICTLLSFFFVFMAVGILVRPLLSNVNRMVARQIKQSGIYNGEAVEVPMRRYRFSQVVRALADKEEYRRVLDARYARFQSMYPKLIRGAIIVGIAVPVVFTIVFSVNMNEKIVVLTAWLLWLVVVSVFMVVVESLKASFERQMKLEYMSDDQLRRMYLDRNGMEKVSDPAPVRTVIKAAKGVEAAHEDGAANSSPKHSKGGEGGEADE